MDQRPTYQSIQALRAIAALLVVLFHLRIVEARYGQGSPVLPEFVRFADAGVDLFFVISGFVITTICAGRYRSPRNAVHFLVQRAWRVVPLYWIYTTLVVVLMTLLPGRVNSSYVDQSVVASYLLWPQSQLPVLTVGWTLIHEMYFYLVMACVIASTRERHVTALLIVWAALIGVAQLQPDRVGSPWLGIVFNAMTLEFVGGALVALHWRRIPRAVARACLPVGVSALFVGMFALDALTLADAISPNPALRRTLVFGSSSVLIVLGAVVWEAHGRLVAPRWLQAIGDSSYSLYLSHVLVISAMGRAWQMSSYHHAPWQHAGFIAVTVCACVAAGIVSYRWLERTQLSVHRMVYRPRLIPDPRVT